MCLFTRNFRCVWPADEEATERAGAEESEDATGLLDGRRKRQPHRVDLRSRPHRVAAVRLPGSQVISSQFAGSGNRLQRASGVAGSRRHQRSLRLQRQDPEGHRDGHRARFVSGSCL